MSALEAERSSLIGNTKLLMSRQVQNVHQF